MKRRTEPFATRAFHAVCGSEGSACRHYIQIRTVDFKPRRIQCQGEDFSKGCVRIVGDQWVLYFYRDEIRDGVRQRVKVSKRIGHMALSKRQARKLAQPIMDEANSQTEIPVREIKNGLTLTEYIPGVPSRRYDLDLKPSTRRAAWKAPSAPT